MRLRTVGRMWSKEAELPKALDARMLIAAGREESEEAPAVEVGEAEEASALSRPHLPPARTRSPQFPSRRAPVAPRLASKPRVTRKQTERAGRPDAGRLRPVGTLLTPQQVSWLYRIDSQAASQRQRPSHSELVRLAIDRLRRGRDARSVAAALNETSPPSTGEYGSYALADDQIRWLREVKGHAFLAGASISQADIIRAAVEALVDLSWQDLRAELVRE